jgi:hypothetical protein
MGMGKRCCRGGLGSDEKLQTLTVSLQVGASLVAASSFSLLLIRQGIHAGMGQMLGLMYVSAVVCPPAILVALGRAGGYVVMKQVVRYALGVSMEGGRGQT